MTRWVWPVLVVLIGTAFVPAGEKKPPHKEIPELKVLDRFAGTWKLEVTNKKSRWIPDGSQGTATAVNEWILNSRFMQLKVKGDKDFEGVYVMTYDPVHKIYRQWAFDSYGGMEESTGTWDEKTQTMTWTGQRTGADATSRSQHIFQGLDLQVWISRTTDSRREVLLDQHGKGTRQK